MRVGEDKLNKYDNGNYIIHNGPVGSSVGFKFNLYDNFMSGQGRTLRVNVPADKDFNHLKLKFKCLKVVNGLDDQKVQCQVYMNSMQCGLEGDVQDMEFPIDNATMQSHSIDIKVVVYYDVDYGKRNVDSEYRDNLKSSGVVLQDIVVYNDSYG